MNQGYWKIAKLLGFMSLLTAGIEFDKLSALIRPIACFLSYRQSGCRLVYKKNYINNNNIKYDTNIIISVS